MWCVVRVTCLVLIMVTGYNEELHSINSSSAYNAIMSASDILTFTFSIIHDSFDL